jgi:cytoskeletal protein RodZ
MAIVGVKGIKHSLQDSNYSMGIRPILVLLAACAGLFGISFAVGELLQRDEAPVKPTSSRSTSPPTTEERTLALGQAPGLPDLRRKPRKPAERTYAASAVAAPPAAAAPPPAHEASVESTPSAEPTPTPTPAAPAPVQQQAPATPTQPQSSTPDNPRTRPAPDAAPSQPSPSPDPYASGGSQYYDDGG